MTMKDETQNETDRIIKVKIIVYFPINPHN